MTGGERVCGAGRGAACNVLERVCTGSAVLRGSAILQFRARTKNIKSTRLKRGFIDMGKMLTRAAGKQDSKLCLCFDSSLVKRGHP